MEEKKTRFVVYSDDYNRGGGRSILGHVNTLAEAQELLVSKWKKLSEEYEPFDEDDPQNIEYEKEIKEILSHTEEELIGRDNLMLLRSAYFSEGIARVPGYVDEEEKEMMDITLGMILKRELAEVKEREWEMTINKEKEKFYLKISGCDKVFVGSKYEHIVGLPTHHVQSYYVYSEMLTVHISNNDFLDVDWSEITAEEVDNRLREYFLSRRMFYSEEDAVNSLPNELVLNKSCPSAVAITPYDKYGYHIEHISASNDNEVFIHIKR